jgi:hypothetical protein
MQAAGLLILAEQGKQKIKELEASLTGLTNGTAGKLGETIFQPVVDKAKPAQKAIEKFKEKWEDLIRKGEQDSLEGQIKGAIETLNEADFSEAKQKFEELIQQGFYDEWKDAIDKGAVNLNDVIAEGQKRAKAASADFTADFKKRQGEALQTFISSVESLFGAVLNIATTIENIFGVTLPDGLKRALTTVQEIAQLIRDVSTIADAINNIAGFINGGGGVPGGAGGIGDIVNGVSGAVGDVIDSVGDFFGFAKGGIITKPTLSVIGESGPEAVIPLKPGISAPGVIPLSNMGGIGGGFIINIDAHGASPGVEHRIRSAMIEVERRIIHRVQRDFGN